MNQNISPLYFLVKLVLVSLVLSGVILLMPLSEELPWFFTYYRSLMPLSLLKLGCLAFIMLVVFRARSRQKRG